MRSGILNTRDAVVVRTGAAVRCARVAAGLSMRALAERVGVSAATISAIENGTTDISVTRLHQLAAALGVAPALLLGLEQPEDPGTPAPPQPSATLSQWRRFPPLRIDPVLSAAIDCFVDTGYHGTTMRTLAARIGVSVPAIYHHYADKQQLLVCSLEVTMNELEWRVAAARAEARTSVEEVALIVEALALFHTHHSKLAFIGASEMRSLEGVNRTRITKRRNAIQRMLDQAIDRAHSDGHLTTRHPRAAGRAIATMCTSLPQWFKPGGPLSADDIARAYTEFALAMLGSVDRGPHE